MDFTGKHVVVTGGGGAIGFETCKQLLMQGVEKVGIFDICESSSKIDDLKKEYSTKTILYVKTDVSNTEDVDNAFKKIIENFKTIDIVISSAGIFNDQTIRKTIDINFFGVLNTTLKAMNIMSIENGGKGGIIAAIASTVGIVPSFSVPVYSASKHAVVGFMRSLSDEFYYKKHGINFVVICPGLTDTNLVANIETKLLFLEAGEELLNQLKGYTLNLASDMGKFVTDILKLAKNGSVWIADNNKIREVEMTNYWP